MGTGSPVRAVGDVGGLRVDEVDQQVHPLGVLVPEIEPDDARAARELGGRGVRGYGPHLTRRDDADVHRRLPQVDSITRLLVPEEWAGERRRGPPEGRARRRPRRIR